jgi:hypothetical protein
MLITFLLFLLNQKMNYTYEAKNNFSSFKVLSQSFLNNKNVNINDISLERKNDINIIYNRNLLNITINNTNFRACLKYGIEYMDSNFQSIKINEQLFTRKDVINREKILEKCNKENNIIILEEKMEKK